MILFQKFGHHGRLGNALFQYASLIGFSKKYNTDLVLPSWDHSKYFAHPPKTIRPYLKVDRRNDIEEPVYHYCPDFWDKQDWNNAINVTGWLQTEKYWEHCRADVLEAFEFEANFLNGVQSHLPNNGRQKVSISVRRGDFVNNPNYAQLPIMYYLGALYENFNPNEVDIIVFSDDFNYCKVHFAAIPNVYYAQHDAITQLALASLCDHFIISNSTFSWWCAYLGDKPHSKIIRPNYLFDGKLNNPKDKNYHNSKDYYPNRWQVYDHVGKKYPLKNVTFTMPVKYDHNDRLQNAGLNVCMLQRDFDTNIILMEQGGDKFKQLGQWVQYVRFDGAEFHRTRMLNDMAILADTPIIVNWDADVLLPPAQVIEAVRALEMGADMVYPYDGRFARVPRTEFPKLEKMLDVGILTDNYRGTREGDNPSVGGAIFFDRESFIEGGMENEYMISYGPEDVERRYRFEFLGFEVQRIGGIIYHIDHFCGPDSTNKHERFKANEAELKKVKGRADLAQYVDTWPWVQRYTEAYYETITENAIRSRDHVFQDLKEHCGPLIKDVKTVIDVGCGLGEWGYQMKEKFGLDYWGVDYKIPVKKLLIPQENYMEVDLRDKAHYPQRDKFDLCLCLEVLEHLSEDYAQQAIDFICSLSDIVVFSAAIKHQGGRHHLNEQMQSYWAKMFAKNKYLPHHKDIRESIANNSNIDLWYRNNIVIYVNCSNKSTWSEQDFKELDYIHPQFYLNIIQGIKAQQK